MSSIKARDLLVRTAFLYSKQKRAFSRQEIEKKIYQIKYLTSQKKVPKLTLRREINLLEDKLQHIYDMEKVIVQRKKYESSKIKALKGEVKKLTKQLAACGDKDLQKKVEKLSHLLGDFLAKKGSSEDIKLSKETLSGLEVGIPLLKEKKQKKVVIKLNPDKIKSIEQRISLLKHELEINKHLKEKDPQKISLIQQKISLIQQKLSSLKGKFSPVKHKMILHPPLTNKEVMNLERQLPLPPPPKMAKV